MITIDRINGRPQLPRSRICLECRRANWNRSSSLPVETFRVHHPRHGLSQRGDQTLSITRRHYAYPFEFG
jgi:hypothetical protein